MTPRLPPPPAALMDLCHQVMIEVAEQLHANSGVGASLSSTGSVPTSPGRCSLWFPGKVFDSARCGQRACIQLSCQVYPTSSAGFHGARVQLMNDHVENTQGGPRC
mmetsp:Transcript_71007/g.166604  ORF Transcript_71007/g.166604 Transcript_71007/m.166604 type:complete len:106 (-) Transcript_71007:120-437(-)